MPKICTEKFNSIGEHMGRTTYKGDVSLDLYFSVQQNNFYFDRDEIKKKFPEVREKDSVRTSIDKEGELSFKYENFIPTFTFCYTRKQAVMAMETFLRGEILNGKITKVLVVQLGMPKRTSKINKKPAHIQKMLGGYFSETSESYLGTETENFGLTLKFKRLYKIERNDTVIYADSFGVWQKPNISKITYNNPDAVEWTAELEAFLIKMQGELERICNQTLEFLETDSLTDLNEKIKSTSLALNPYSTL